jgi:hypothetical protein
MGFENRERRTRKMHYCLIAPGNRHVGSLYKSVMGAARALSFREQGTAGVRTLSQNHLSCDGVFELLWSHCW